MTLAFVVYGGLAVVCGLCAYRADKSQRKEYVWLIIAVLTLIAGLRGVSVGIDTQSYLEKIEMLNRGRFDLAYGLENSFKIIVYLILSIIPSPQVVLILFAFVTNWCIISRFWELRKVSWFPCMVLCYYMSFYFVTMNTMRQFCAVAIVFYCVRFLDQKRVMRFMMGVLAAMLLHRSAALGIGYLLIYCVRWEKMPEHQKRIYKLCAMALPVVAVLVLLLGIFKRYGKYLAGIELDIGMMLPLKMMFLVGVVVVFFFLEKRRESEALRLNDKTRFALMTSCMGYGAALLLGATGYLFPEMDRISWYYFLYEGVFFGALLKKKTPFRKGYFGFMVFVIGYGFLYSMLNNSQGQMPFAFGWYTP